MYNLSYTRALHIYFCLNNRNSLMRRKLEEQLNVRIGKTYLDAIDKLVEKQVYASRGEVVRDALRTLFGKYKIEMKDGKEEK